MTLSINLPESTQVESSIGTLYTRYLSVGDLIALAENDLNDMPDHRIGQLAIQRTTSRDPESKDRPSLSDQDFSSLDEKDLSALTADLSRLSDVAPDLDGPAVTVLRQP